MQGFSSAVLSLVAMALSSLTTYLTFFDARYTLSATLSRVDMQVQSSGGMSNGMRSAYYRVWPTAQIILSNRGTRAVVLSDLQLVRSDTVEGCNPVGEAYDTRIEPVVIEPGTVQTISVEFELDPVSFEYPDGAAPPLPEAETQHWCMRWTAFDPEGRRREPVTSFFTLQRRFEMPEADGRSPRVDYEMDYPRAPETIVAKGLF